jgi:predicted Zn-dependent peptidase
MKLYPFKKNVFIPNKIEMGLFGLAYRQTGGFFETPGTRGTSHLMEHLMCKPFDDMRDELKSLGVDNNAYTDDNQVVFWFSGLTESVREIAERIYEKVTKQDVLWTEEAFEIEKRTVLQEYGDTFNSQESGFYYNLMRQHYNYCGAIGYLEDIKSFTYEQSLVRAKEFTVPSIICQVGEQFIRTSQITDTDETITTMGDLYVTSNDNLMYASKNPSQLKFGDYSLELENVPRDGKVLVGLLGSKPTDLKNIQMLNFIINCINGGLEAPLYDEIREKRGLSYYSAGDALHVGELCLPMFFASTDKDNVDNLEKVYAGFFTKHGADVITEDRFNTCKKAVAIKQRIADILPHAGAKMTVLGDINPFEGIAHYTYQQVIDKYNELMHIDNYIPVKY